MRQRRLKHDAGAADQEAGGNGSRHAAKAADHRGDEGDQHDVGAHPDIRRAGVGRQDQPDCRRQHAADGKGQQNDPVGAYPQHAGHGEVLRSSAHLQTVARAFEEQRQGGKDGRVMTIVTTCSIGMRAPKSSTGRPRLGHSVIDFGRLE